MAGRSGTRIGDQLARSTRTPSAKAPSALVSASHFTVPGYAAAGHLTALGTRAHAYDGLERFTTARESGKTLATQAYDASARRVHEDDRSGSPSVTRRFVRPDFEWDATRRLGRIHASLGGAGVVTQVEFCDPPPATSLDPEATDRNTELALAGPFRKFDGVRRSSSGSFLVHGGGRWHDAAGPVAERHARARGGRGEEQMPCTVLVANDRDDVRALVRDEIADVGVTVVEAADGEEAWALFRRERPRVVITALRMPRIDGLELLRRIRSVSDVSVMVLTAFGDVPTAVATMQAGAADFCLFPDALGGLQERLLRLDNRRPTRGSVAARSKVTKLRVQEQRRQCRELETVLCECGGNLASSARRLELSRGAVFYRAQKFGMLVRVDPYAAGARARSAEGKPDGSTR